MAKNHDAMTKMTAAATMSGGHWCQCDNVTISHNEVKIHEWQQRLRWRTRGCSSSCVLGREACCWWTGNQSGQEAPADSNGKGSEDNNKESKEESKGVEGEGVEGEGDKGKGNKGKGDEGEGDEGKGNEGDDGNFPEEGWR